jgi:glycosyltransferase involved in cell wall biosynthesis
MPELVFILMGSNPGGIELQIPLLVNSLPEYNPEVYLIHGLRTQKKDIFAGHDFKVNPGARKLPQSAVCLYRYARQNRNRIFHGFNIGPLFLLILHIAGIRKVVYSIRGTIYGRTPLKKFITRLLWRIAIKKNTQLISNSDFSGEKFRQEVCPGASVTRIYNPIDINRFYYLHPSYPSVPNRVIYAGRMARGKNLLLWIRTAGSIARQYAQTEFHLYGDGDIKTELQAAAIENGLQGRITFHGHTKAIEKAYQSADLMIFLSDHESFGNVVVEAVLAGVPVICSSIPSMREIFSGYPEFLVDLNEHTPELVLSKIPTYSHLVLLTQKVQAEFMKTYSADNHICKLKELYNAV